MMQSSLERSTDSTSSTASIRTSSRISRPAAWARFGVQASIAYIILFTALGLMIYDVVIHLEPTVITNVWLPIVTFIVGLFFNTKHAKDKKPKPVASTGHLDRDEI
jgi:hypothetical protein